MIKKLMLPALILAAFIFILQPSYAGNDRGFLLPVDSSSYEILKYPSDDSSFSIPFGFEVKHQIKNGKYFYFEVDDMIGTPEFNYDIYFYSPDGKLISKQNVRKPSDSFIIPVNENSLNADFLLIRITNNGHESLRNFKLVVACPKSEIKGEKSKRKFENFYSDEESNKNAEGK